MGRPLETVPPGRVVRVPGTKLVAEVVELNHGSVTVNVVRQVERSFTTADGKKVSFKTERETTTWSRLTNVEVV